jgi:hypothetical protein
MRVKKIGRRQWKKESGYHQRKRSESDVIVLLRHLSA